MNGPPGDGPGDVAGLFELERARLLDLLGSVAGAEWDEPTPCPEWTVLGLCCATRRSPASSAAPGPSSAHRTDA